MQDDRVRLLLLADTHIPRRARDLPAQVWAEVAKADVVLHAGDWVAPELLDAETGPAGGREARMSRLHPDSDVLVFGHSQIPWDTTSSTGLRLLNPGSPTDRRRQPSCTYMTATVENGQLMDVVLHDTKC